MHWEPWLGWGAQRCLCNAALGCQSLIEPWGPTCSSLLMLPSTFGSTAQVPKVTQPTQHSAPFVRAGSILNPAGGLRADRQSVGESRGLTGATLDKHSVKGLQTQSPQRWLRTTPRFLYLDILLNPCGSGATRQGYIKHLLTGSLVLGRGCRGGETLLCGRQLLEAPQPWRHLHSS